MAHRETDSTTAGDLQRPLIGSGLEGMTPALETHMNEAMKLKRTEFVGTAALECAASRCGCANDLKPREIRSDSSAPYSPRPATIAKPGAST